MALIWFCHPLEGVEEIKKYYMSVMVWRATQVVDIPLVCRVKILGVVLEPNHPSVPVVRDFALNNIKDSTTFLRKFGEYVRGMNK